MSVKIATGKKGETEAVEFLIDNGFEILEKNWIFKHKEIDIIAKKGDVTVFFEVKTRSTNIFQEPKEAVDLRKRKNMIFAATGYVEKTGYAGDIRFDIISIVNQDNKVILEHIENAFHPLTI